MTAAQECVLLSSGACLQCEICHSMGKSCSGPMKTCTGGEDTCGIILHEVLIGEKSSKPVWLSEWGWLGDLSLSPLLSLVVWSILG